MMGSMCDKILMPLGSYQCQRRRYLFLYFKTYQSGSFALSAPHVHLSDACNCGGYETEVGGYLRFHA